MQLPITCYLFKIWNNFLGNKKSYLDEIRFIYQYIAWSTLLRLVIHLWRRSFLWYVWFVLQYPQMGNDANTQVYQRILRWLYSFAIKIFSRYCAKVWNNSKTKVIVFHMVNIFIFTFFNNSENILSCIKIKWGNQICFNLVFAWRNLNLSPLLWHSFAFQQTYIHIFLFCIWSVLIIHFVFCINDYKLLNFLTFIRARFFLSISFTLMKEVVNKDICLHLTKWEYI